MKRWKKVCIWCAGFLIVLILFGFFGAPPILKSVLVKKLSQELNRDVSIGKISVNPLLLRVKLRRLIVKEKQTGTIFLSLERFEAGADISMLKGKIALRNIYLYRPFVNLVRNDNGTYNFSDLMAKGETKGPEEPKAKTPVFSVRGISIDGGSADFLDAPFNKQHTIRELNLTIPYISNARKEVEKNVQPQLSLIVNDAPYKIYGKTKPFMDTRETSFDINIDNINIPFYIPYIPMQLPVNVVSGNLDLRTQLRFREDLTNGKEPVLDLTGDVSITKLHVQDKSRKPVLTLPELKIAIDSIEPFAGKAHISNVTVTSPELILVKQKDGTLNISEKVDEKKNTAGKQKKEGAADPAKKEESGSFQFLLDTLQVTKAKASFHDRSLKAPANLLAEQIELKAENISLEKGKNGQFSTSLVLNKKGTIDLRGSVGLNPLTIQAKTTVKSVDIRPFEPYFTDTVNIAIVRGSAHTNGELSIKTSDDKGPQITFSGTASVTRFAMVDKERADELFSMDSLHLRNIEFQNEPMKLNIRSVALNDFRAAVIIEKDRSLNFQNIKADEGPVQGPVTPVKGGSKEKKTVEKEKGRPSVKIDNVTLQAGTIDFHDYSIEPEFSKELNEIGGRISGLSSNDMTKADVDLKGKYDRFAPLEIVGKINPLAKDLFVDLKVSFKNMELSPVTPYSGKYIGYVIDRGQFSFDVQYFINGKKLDAKNDIFIDQLTLGNRVESKDAVKAPVKLAIALLKDRQGRIKLDIPVTGSLDDPEFSVWKIVVKVLMNLLAKAATAPFALIGSLFGGGEELGYVEFDYGSNALVDASAKKIDTLAKALYEKPELRLDITGFVDIERDRDGLKQYLVQKKVKTQKMKDMLKTKTESLSVDEIKVEPAEYEKYLRLAYKAETFPKPRNAIGFEKTIPVDEMEKLMITHTQITNDDLRALAARRSATIRDAILKTGRVDAGRLFTIEPKSLSPEKKEKIRDARVDFTLK
ncbi:MAG TPA: DUF748 domain-containing protein [Syntrophorhabdaceae bacterium]|nr:DUF748 domain-containing protein [Syntrophorhabdaceae bacterium]